MKRLFTLVLLLVSTIIVCAHTITLKSGRQISVLIDKITKDYVYYHTISDNKVKSISQKLILSIEKNEQEEEFRENTLDKIESVKDVYKPEIIMKGMNVYVDGIKMPYEDVATTMLNPCREASDIASHVHRLRSSRRGLFFGYFFSVGALFWGYTNNVDLDSDIESCYFKTEEEMKEFDERRKLNNGLIYGGYGLLGITALYHIYTYFDPYFVMKRSIKVYQAKNPNKSSINMVPFVGINQVGVAINF